MVGFDMTNSRETLHPGRILLTQAMEPLGISRNQLARDLDVPVGRISDITNGKRGVTADTALRLGRYFGTGPELWLRLQAEYDLYVARMTTWPAVESRVRVLSSEAPVEDAPSADDTAVEKDVFVGADPVPISDAFAEETSAAPESVSGQPFEKSETYGEPEKIFEETGSAENQTEAPQADSAEPTPEDTDINVEPNPDPFTDRDEDLGIPPIPDRTKLYQSG
jgi:addiction module HigA family antidote